MKITVQQFSEQNKISKALAKRVLDALYSKDYDAKSLERVLRRMRSMLEKKAIPDLMEKLDNVQINQLIDEMQADDSQDCELQREYSEAEFGVWLFSDLGSEFADKNFKEGDKVDIQIMRSGKWNHPMYGEIKVDNTVLSDVVKNFEEDKRGIELAVDENHEPNHKALARYKKLYLQGRDALFATLELTKKGAELLNEGAYKYFSPEIIFAKKDEETGELQKNLLIGGAFTNRPFFKAMQPLLASENGMNVVSNGHQNNSNGTVSNSEDYILAFNSTSSMNKFLQLVAKFSELVKISKEDKTELEQAFSEIPAGETNEEMKQMVADICSKFSEDGDDAEQGQEGAEGEGNGDDAGEDGADDQGSDSDDAAVTASEGDEEVTIKASELNALRENAVNAAKAARTSAITAKVNSLKFSESNKIGIVLPKKAQDVVNFALLLNDKQAEKFFSIVESFQTIAANEIGNGSSPSVTAGEMQKKDSALQFYADKLGLTAEQAEASFNEYMNTK